MPQPWRPRRSRPAPASRLIVSRWSSDPAGPRRPGNWAPRNHDSHGGSAAFSPPSAAGHGGSVLSVPIGDSDERMLILLGRIHAYEGHDLRHVVHPVRTACAAGARTIILTNAAGGLREDYAVGQPVLISDHLNLTARSPLVGAQFVDLVDAYSPRLRALAREIDDNLTEGVYAGLPGPHYETPAEIRMLRTLGADLVGMSTVQETIAARAAGAEVLGVSW